MNALNRYRGGWSDAHSLVLMCVDTHTNRALHVCNHILSEGEKQLLHSRCCYLRKYIGKFLFKR